MGVDGAGGHDDGVGGHLLHGAVGLLHREGLGAGEAGLAVHAGDLVLLQQTGNTLGQLLADGVLVGDHLGEIHFHTGDLHADVSTLFLDLGHQLRAVQQALGGDAADVQAGAADVLALHQGHLGAQLGRPDGSHIAAGAAAHDDNGLLASCGGGCSRGRCSRSGGNGCGCGGSRGAGSIGNRLSGGADPGDHALAGGGLALRQQDLQQGAVLLGLHVVGQLIGRHGEQDVPLLDGVSLFELPLFNGALGHRQTQ
ncbi:3'-phosphoadenosine 5'-phosphosulfate sulfotransferase (PAPS reductase)/FAD synthetase or related enzyme, partial [Dysosmobacter welbionis]